MVGIRSTQGAAGPRQVRDILAGQIAEALKTLGKPTKVSDQSVHDARKYLKRARASLRLIRDAIGDTLYARENTALRDAARPLTPVRDARVMLDTAKGLIEAEKDKVFRTTLVRLQHTFLAEWRHRQAEMIQSVNGLQTVIRSLEQARHRASRLTLKEERTLVLFAGLRRIYLKGRKAMQNADTDRTDEKLHEARKQAKYFAAAIATFDSIGLVAKKEKLKRAEAVAGCLGADHDLALLGLKLRSSDKTLAAHLKQRRAELQKQALKKARRLYRKKPGAFVKSLGG